MKLIDAAKAFKAAEKLSQMDMKNWNAAKRIYLLRERLRGAWQFMAEEEDKIRQNHPNLNPMTGVVTIPGGTNEEARLEVLEIDKEFNELHDTEWMDNGKDEINGKIVIRQKDLGMPLTGDLIGALIDYVDFEGDEDDAAV